jgi:phage shock protein C
MMPTTSPYKRLYRSRRERMIAGICGGLAEYFCIDPTWTRLFFIFFFLAFGSTALLYIILWVIVPLAPE